MAYAFNGRTLRHCSGYCEVYSVRRWPNGVKLQAIRLWLTGHQVIAIVRPTFIPQGFLTP